MLGKEVKVCTLDNVKGICLVAEDTAGDICLISKDNSLTKAEFFWKIDSERERINNCTDKYVAGHYCWKDDQLTDQLKWVTSSVPSNNPAKETEEEFILEPKTVEELWAKAPCKVRLCDGQIGYAEKEDGRERHAVVYFNDRVDNGSGTGSAGWLSKHPPYKRGWYVNGTYDFEKIFGKKKEELTRDNAFRPLNIEQLKEQIPCHVLLKDGQIGYVDYERGTPTVYFNDEIDGMYGWKTDAEGFKYGWHIHDEEDFEDVFEVFEDKLAQSAEPVEKTPEDTSVLAVLKDILETLKEIKNEIAKR